jgi:hypothetical protein
MDNKRRLYRLVEKYVNDFKKEAVEEFYGKGSSIKIHNVTFAQKNKSIVIEAIIVLGDIITESQMDEKMATVLISDAITYFFPELSIHLTFRWDV